MRRLQQCLPSELESDWRHGMFTLTEQISESSAFLYRFDKKSEGLSLICRGQDEKEVPEFLDGQDATIRQILEGSKPFVNDKGKFGEVFAGFPYPILVMASLRFENKVMGLLVVGKTKYPPRNELESLTSNAVHFSLLLAVEDLCREKQEWAVKSSLLEQRLQAAYQQILKSDKTDGLIQFARGLAHELNTPLGAIQTYAEYLQLYVKGETEQESLEGVLKAVTHCRDVVEGVLRVAREGKRELEPMVLAHAIHDAMVFTEPELERKKIRLTSHTRANPMILGNHTRLVQVITNLLTNAKDSIVRSRLVTRKGLIALTLAAENGSAIVQVEDNGAGIPDSILGQVFDPFFTTKEIGEGNGLGLSICHAIIEEHHGTIEIFGNEGRGARAVIKIPLFEGK